MVALFQCLLCQTLPALRSVDLFRCLHCHFKVTTFNGKLKSSVCLLHEVKRDLMMGEHHTHTGILRTYLWESLLLQVTNDALSQKVRVLDDVQHLFVIVLEKCKLEAVFGGVKCDCSWPSRAVETVDSLALDASEVNGIIEGAYNTVIAGQDGKLRKLW